MGLKNVFILQQYIKKKRLPQQIELLHRFLLISCLLNTPGIKQEPPCYQFKPCWAG